MELYTSQHFNISVSTTKVLFKITNNKSGNTIKIDTRKLKRAYELKNTHMNTKTLLNRVLFLLDCELSDLKPEIKADSKRVEALKYLQTKAFELRDEFMTNYSYVCLFKETMNL